MADPPTPEPVAEMHLTMKEDAGTVVMARWGTITDGWDPVYPRVKNPLDVTVLGRNCLVTFTALDLEDAACARKDFVQILVTGAGGWLEWATDPLCGHRDADTLPAPVQLSGDGFTVRFKTSKDDHFSGFAMDFYCQADTDSEGEGEGLPETTTTTTTRTTTSAGSPWSTFARRRRHGLCHARSRAARRCGGYYTRSWSGYRCLCAGMRGGGICFPVSTLRHASADDYCLSTGWGAALAPPRFLRLFRRLRVPRAPRGRMPLHTRCVLHTRCEGRAPWGFAVWRSHKRLYVRARRRSAETPPPEIPRPCRVV
eukprot:TRINITY_DN2474_c0_g2_i1.p1 TRINITY_DN2474_c0_g2~~TRINITY_DN2474_c0_g2_i1.p1  ORF type:complete len:359 (+),score=20.12 TRINITY_DN2474_c0_g2_i1:142-1077(+)